MITSEETGRIYIEFENVQELATYVQENFTGELLGARLVFTPSCEATFNGLTRKYRSWTATIQLASDTVEEVQARIQAEKEALQKRIAELDVQAAALDTVSAGSTPAEKMV